jgi:hypothetical protein
MEGVVRWLELNGFLRASTVREPGDYAVRGGILDLFAPGMDLPVRLDFFGDTLETIRSLRSRDPAHDRIARARSRAGEPNSSSPPRRSAASAPAMSRPSAPPARDDRSTRR